MTAEFALSKQISPRSESSCLFQRSSWPIGSFSGTRWSSQSGLAGLSGLSGLFRFFGWSGGSPKLIGFIEFAQFVEFFEFIESTQFVGSIGSFDVVESARSFLVNLVWLSRLSGALVYLVDFVYLGDFVKLYRSRFRLKWTH